MGGVYEVTHYPTCSTEHPQHKKWRVDPKKQEPIFYGAPCAFLVDTRLVDPRPGGVSSNGLRLSGAIWSCLGLSGATWGFLALSGAIWSPASGAIGGYLELPRVTYLGLYGAIRGLPGAIWSYPGAIWDYLDLPGAVWT